MSGTGLPMQLTVPSDAKFRAIMVTMTRRIAESVGFSSGEADRLGREVADQARAAVHQAAADPATPLDVTYDLHGQRLCVRASCRGASFEVTRALPGV